jgi:hypothetical protein
MIDEPELTTPTDVLLGFAQMLEYEVTDARRAAYKLWTGDGYAQDSATLMLVHSTIVENYLWGSGATKRVKATYPNLVKDLCKLVGFKRGSALTSVRTLRDATIHLEERVALRFTEWRRWELEHPGEIQYRSTPLKWWQSVIDPPEHALMWWNPETLILTIDGVSVSPVVLQEELDALHERIGETIQQLIDRFFDWVEPAGDEQLRTE